MKKTILFLILNLCIIGLSSQQLNILITDTLNRPLSYATIYINELQRGAAADEHGKISMKLPAGEYNYEVSSLGYVTQKGSQVVTTGETNLQYRLAEHVFHLNEVNVVGSREDPAYNIMRHAIAQAPFYGNMLKSYQADVYLKGTGKALAVPKVLKLSGGLHKEAKLMTNRLFLLEEEKQVKFVAPDKYTTKVLAYKQSFPEQMQVAFTQPVMNLYEPEFFNKISPLNKNAFAYYRYKLENCFTENGLIINKIKFTPKIDNPKLVSGELYIIDGLWCLSAVEIAIDLSGVDAQLKIMCKSIKPKVYLPVTTHLDCQFNIMGFKAEATYYSSIRYKDVVADVNVLQPERMDHLLDFLSKDAQLNRHKQLMDKFNSSQELTNREARQMAAMNIKYVEGIKFEGKRRKYELSDNRTIGSNDIDSLANDRDEAYWNSVRTVPLQEDEVLSYQNAPAIKDSLDQLQKRSTFSKIMRTFLIGNKFKTNNGKFWIALHGLPSYITEFNFVDGYWVGADFSAGAKLSERSALRLDVGAYYATARRAFVGETELSLDYAPRRNGLLYAKAGTLSTDYNNVYRNSRLLNAFLSAFFGNNAVKFYDQKYITLGNCIDVFNGFQLNISGTWQERSMLRNHIKHSWFGTKAKPNYPEVEVFQPMPRNYLLKFETGAFYSPGNYYRMVNGRKVYEASSNPVFSLNYERAFPVDNSHIYSSWQALKFTVRQQIPLGMFNLIDWQLSSGFYWDRKDMQFPDYQQFPINGIPFAGQTFNVGFSIANPYEYSTDHHWVQAEASWYTPKLLLKRIPFLRSVPFNEGLHARTIKVYDKKLYTEIGYSVGSTPIARVGLFVNFNGAKFNAVGIGLSVPILEKLQP